MTEHRREDEELDSLVREVVVVPDYLKDPAALVRKLKEEVSRRKREGIPMPEMPSLEDGELTPTPVVPKPGGDRRSVRLLFSKRPLVWVGVAALVLAGAAVIFLAVRPTSPQTVQPKTDPLPPEGPKQAIPPLTDEIDASLKPEELVASKAFDTNVVFHGDKFTHSTTAKTRRRYGWCYQIDAGGSQLLYALRSDGPQRLAGQLPRPRTFDKPPKAVYEYFVVILADDDHPALGLTAGKGGGNWLSAQERKSLQDEGRQGPAAPAAERVLKSALNRLGLSDGAFYVEAKCYLHHPHSR